MDPVGPGRYAGDMDTPHPILDRGDLIALRDPALVFHDGVCHCFHTVATPAGRSYSLGIDVAVSRDLVDWRTRTILPAGPSNWSSPGSIVRQGGEWVMCLQSYPIPPGACWADETARLWTSRSCDLVTWSAPRPIAELGAEVTWSTSRRQIDPYLVAHAGRWWCFYKTAGQLGLLVSDDLVAWCEASPDRPVFGIADTPDHCTVENPCVVPCERGYALIFAPCRPGRGVGIAYSDDLLTWRDVHYLDLPPIPWATGGPTAAVVVDRRREDGVWLMAFNGDRPSGANEHSAAIALLRSRDLETWRS